VSSGATTQPRARGKPTPHSRSDPEEGGRI
jgi:hypothetical protein